MAYNKNTNWDNEEKYLSNLMNSGSSGQKAWAQNQLSQLNAAKSQQAASNPNTNGTSVTQSTTSSSGYTPQGTHHDATIKTVSDTDTQRINQYKEQWVAAKAAGDTAGMEAAHAAAEAIRKGYNYSGGGDGSDYIEIPIEEILTAPTFNWDSSRPTYEGTRAEDIDALLDQILNRDKFSYNLENDPLWGTLKQQYLREGNRAMNDTLASAASNAGGMNSYAVTAAQQANNYYGAQLNDRIPELYEMAYGMYLDDIDGQVRDLGLLNDMDYTQYSRYRDTMNDWESDRGFAYNQYRDDMSDYFNNRDFQYGVGRDEVDDKRYENEWNYNTGMNDSETAYKRAMDFLDAGVMPSASVLSAAGISTSEAQAYLARVAATNAVSGRSSGGGNSYKPKTKTEVVRPEKVQGKPIDDYEAAAGNYQTVAASVEEIYNTQGKAKVLDYLREAYANGVLNLSDYTQLFSKYRNM